MELDFGIPSVFVIVGLLWFSVTGNGKSKSPSSLTSSGQLSSLSTWSWFSATSSKPQSSSVAKKKFSLNNLIKYKKLKL